MTARQVDRYVALFLSAVLAGSIAGTIIAGFAGS